MRRLQLAPLTVLVSVSVVSAQEPLEQELFPIPVVPFVEEPPVTEAKVAGAVEPSESGFGLLVQREFSYWSGQFAAGLNGTAGNADRFNTRLGFDGRRETPKTDLKLTLSYSKATADGLETENKFLSNARNEWKLHDSPWSVYLFNSGAYDEFQAWDYRLVTGGGVGYRFVNTDRTSLQGRFGGGVSREFGGPDNRFIPEANVGLDFEHRINDRQKLTGGVEYFPSFLDVGDFRVDSKAAWEILIDPEWNLSLKIGFLDRYQSMPEGAKPNDVDYFAELVWKF